MRVILDIKDSEAVHLMHLLYSLPYVKTTTFFTQGAERSIELESAGKLTDKEVALGIGNPFKVQAMTDYLTKTGGRQPKKASLVKPSLKKCLERK